MVDGLTLKASYLPTGSGTDSATAWSASYTGVEGLTVSYGQGDGNSPSTDIDVSTLDATYAFGPLTVGYSQTEYDSAAANSDKETTSYALTYTVSDEISVTYGTEEIQSDATAAVEDAEFAGVSVSYTAGGMTITAKMQDADNIDGTTTATEDRERWALGASFAF